MISYFPTLLIDAFGCKQVLTLKFRNLWLVLWIKGSDLTAVELSVSPFPFPVSNLWCITRLDVYLLLLLCTIETIQNFKYPLFVKHQAVLGFHFLSDK